jgi:hypothetical protein
MSPYSKPFNFLSPTVVSNADQNGNKFVCKMVNLHGKSTLLQFVIRSEQDVVSTRNKGYKLLVP